MSQWAWDVPLVTKMNLAGSSSLDLLLMLMMVTMVTVGVLMSHWDVDWCWTPGLTAGMGSTCVSSPAGQGQGQGGRWRRQHALLPTWPFSLPVSTTAQTPSCCHLHCWYWHYCMCLTSVLILTYVSDSWTVDPEDDVCVTGAMSCFWQRCVQLYHAVSQKHISDNLEWPLTRISRSQYFIWNQILQKQCKIDP